MQLLYPNKSIVLKILHYATYSGLGTVIFLMINRQEYHKYNFGYQVIKIYHSPKNLYEASSRYDFTIRPILVLPPNGTLPGSKNLDVV